MTTILKQLQQEINHVNEYTFYGEVISAKGNIIECAGLAKIASIGYKCVLLDRENKQVDAQIIGFKGEVVILMPLAPVGAIGAGCRVIYKNISMQAFPDSSWMGRVINANTEPIDNKGPLAKGMKAYSYTSPAPKAHERKRVEGKIDLGVRAINTFTPCCKGQRMGIFAGSGVGKSVLISMMTKYCSADVRVIGLIGERGREVNEFIEDQLGPEGLKNSILVVATGDESALTRKNAAYLTLTISEYFRDLGKDVLCVIDSVTRFAMAQREIGLSAGEPPTTKGYTPTVFSELPALLERAGPGTKQQGTITGIFSVLVDGDDHNEPISDAVRGILDGHIVLDRKIAEKGLYPAINVLKSVSRTLPACNTDDENQLIHQAKEILSTYTDMEDLIKIGAYKAGSDKKTDQAIKHITPLEELIRQKPTEKSSLTEGYVMINNILNTDQKSQSESTANTDKATEIQA